MQGAGKQNVSSLHTNFNMREAIHYANDRGSTVHVVCLDIEKAFDKVWQNGLLYKLHEKGINSTLWQIIADSFKNFKLKDIQNTNNCVKVYDTEIASPSFADDMSHIFK